MNAIVCQGDARHLPFPDDSIDLVVTSPPYFGLRSYTDGGAHYATQLGAEATPREFVAALIECTREMARVIKPTGSIFVNLGDKYAGSGGYAPNAPSNVARREGRANGGGYDGAGRSDKRQAGSGTKGARWGLPAKSLALLPERYRIACVDELRLIARAVIVWEKPNGLPESVTDRVRRSHEDWVHLTKSQRYFSEIDVLREPATSNYHDRPQYRRAMELFSEHGFTDEHLTAVRAVGVADTAGGAVRSGGRFTSRAGVLANEVRVALRSYYRELCGSNTAPRGSIPTSVWRIPTQGLRVPPELNVNHFAAFPMEWPRRLILGWSPPGGIVLDPFGGTGTTALVADVLGRTGISLDASADYGRIAAWRTADPKQRARAERAA